MSSSVARADTAAHRAGTHEENAPCPNLSLTARDGDTSALGGSLQTVESAGLTECWRQIPGFAGYEVSTLGAVRSWRPLRFGSPAPAAPRLLRLVAGPGGYLRVTLCAGRLRTDHRVHRLVLLAFVGPRPEGLVSRHLDGRQTNNRLDNLAYGTRSENEQDKRAHGTYHAGAKNPRARLTEQQVAEIRAQRGVVSQSALAKLFGVSKTSVRDAQTGKTWGSELRARSS